MSKWFAVGDWHDVPRELCGVYAIYESGERLVYIGSSGNLRDRVRCQQQSRRFRSTIIKFRECLDRLALERRLVRRLRPSQNKVINVAQRVRGPQHFYGFNPYDGPCGY
jgi:hypothetical protein